jgi:hypothetical protein
MHVRLLAAVLWLGAPGVAVAQGRIAGRAVDPNGNTVQGVRISINALSLTAITNNLGEYAIDNAPAGTWTVQATRMGYQATSRTIDVVTGQTSTVNFVMQPVPAAFIIVSPTNPVAPLPPDSVRLPVVPDSAILNRRQAETVSFDLRPGQRGAAPLFPPNTVLILVVESVSSTPRARTASGSVVESDGTVTGTFSIVERNGNVTANIRRGLKLYQIRPQVRGIHLIIEVDQSKVISPGEREHDGGGPA